MRAPNWDVKLLEWAAGLEGKPFVWGETDCALLALEAHDLVTGSALAEAYRGRWDSEFAARRFIVEHSTDIERRLLAAGCDVVAPGYLQRGDFILVAESGWICAHVCMGAWTLSSRPDVGVVQFDCAAVLRCAGARILRPG